MQSIYQSFPYHFCIWWILLSCASNIMELYLSEVQNISQIRTHREHLQHFPAARQNSTGFTKAPKAIRLKAFWSAKTPSQWKSETFSLLSYLVKGFVFSAFSTEVFNVNKKFNASNGNTDLFLYQVSSSPFPTPKSVLHFIPYEYCFLHLPETHFPNFYQKKFLSILEMWATHIFLPLYELFR